ncbi:MAG: YCF48-related protein [Atribacterota bacterium]|nr:YCF48-related protein [Atribacterota bacterium]
MPEQEFTFTLSNPSATDTTTVALLNPTETTSQKSTKYRAVTPYTPTYSAGSTFILRTDLTTLTFSNGVDYSPSDVVDYMNSQFANIGTFSLYANNAIDGTVYQVQSPSTLLNFEINLSVHSWTEQLNVGGFGIYGVSFASSLIGIAGYLGGVYYTTDGGSSWNIANDGSATQNTSVTALSTGVGYSCGYSGNIHKTSNISGGIWAAQVSGTIGNLYSIYFIDDNTGWVCGDTGEIRNTANGGTNWNAQVSGSVDNLYGIFFLDANNGWACGANGTVLYTTNGGTNWNAGASGILTDILSIFFIDANNGWACGASGEIIYTTDGGLNWNPQVSGVAGNINSIFFTDANNGWACCASEVILSTNDGGTTWTPETLGTGTEELTGIYFTSQYNGWTVGNYAGSVDLIYKYS